METVRVLFAIFELIANVAIIVILLKKFGKGRKK